MISFVCLLLLLMFAHPLVSLRVRLVPLDPRERLVPRERL